MNVKQVIVAGYVCLDMTPDLSSVPEGQFETLLQPGKMIQTGGIQLSAGGAVPNTGLALHKLGVPTRLIGKIGEDLFGEKVREIISRDAPQLVDDLVNDPGAATGFTIILNPPGFDRAFLHFPGANDTFYASDLPRTILQSADLFHFGYPSLMRSIYRADGGELVSILQRARRAGLSTSLDFSLPDPTSPGGSADWSVILENSLPWADLFLPSVEELVFLLKPETYQEMCADPEVSFHDRVTPDLLHDLSEIVLDYGVKIVMIKLGCRGIYLRTAPSAAWGKVGRGLEGLGETWADRELWVPAFNVAVRGTAGAGDAAVAGFLASLLRGVDPETAVTIAAACGGCSVETPDALSGLLTWEGVSARVKQGWEALPLDLEDPHWHRDEQQGFWWRE